ncbi:MAG: Dam family site-specific DNA-(adenine-N6)-methyltransferase [Alphaproteobacteria bacterium]|nr:MAG: Dam family site-specific DNA-(adenine-N6)-methyltransferase [Alphaproteobacteria bacterium]
MKQPFLKWAGGKRWLFTDEFIKGLPPFDRYCEPFLGGGAGFFRLAPIRADLSDVNVELINLYKQIRDNPIDFGAALKSFHQQHSKDFYYLVRSSKFEPDLMGAVRTLYLNRTCWNGLYRVNQRGEFNVPIGTKTSIFDEREDFEAISETLQRTTLNVSDFEAAIDRCGEGDLAFVDPPYTVRHNMNGFVKYNEAIFSWADQERLARAIKRAASRGTRVILTNADHPSVRELYDEIGTIQSIARSSVISGSVKGRSKTTELLVTA